MRNTRYSQPDRPAARSPYETLTVGRLVASLLVVPLFVAVLAVPTLVVAAAAGAATVLLFERLRGLGGSVRPNQEQARTTGETTTTA